MTMTRISTLDLHVSRGIVWYGVNTNLAKNSRQSVEEFLASDAFCGIACVRLMGSHANAPLIVSLYDQQQKGNIGRIKVGSPLMCSTAAARREPMAVLLRMRTFTRAPSQGGFHDVTENDYRAYALAVATTPRVGVSNAASPATLRLLRSHPAWKSLSFIPHLDPVACAGLLGYILDPRWYIDECHPDRLSKLEACLGLHPKTQAGVTCSRFKQWGRHNQCKLVLSCWKRPGLERTVRDLFEVTTPIPVEGDERPGLAPGSFPWRIWGWRNAIGLPERDANPVLADLRASQKLLAFLRHTWMSALYRDSPAMPEQGAGLFRACDFFKHPSEIAAFELHQIKAGC